MDTDQTRIRKYQVLHFVTLGGELKAYMHSKTSGLRAVEVLERLATAAWAGESLAVREAALELLQFPLHTLAAPTGLSPAEVIVAAALVELLAARATGASSMDSKRWCAA